MANPWITFWNHVDAWEAAGRPMASDTYEVMPAPLADDTVVRVLPGHGMAGCIGTVIRARWLNPIVRFEFPEDVVEDIALPREWLERVG